jgi:hypothetical protein
MSSSCWQSGYSRLSWDLLESCCQWILPRALRNLTVSPEDPVHEHFKAGRTPPPLSDHLWHGPCDLQQGQQSSHLVPHRPGVTIMLCSPLKVNSRFGRTSPPSSGLNKLSKILEGKQVASRSVDFQQITHHHIPENSLHNHQCENLKCYTVLLGYGPPTRLGGWHNLEDRNVSLHCCENLKCHIVIVL